VETTEKLVGSIERVTFQNEESGYAVIQVKARGQKDLITVVGHHARFGAGETIEASGSWTLHRQFGMQFHAESIKVLEPTSLEGMEKYLGSGMIKGIGPHIAHLLVDHFGLSTFEVIEKNPQKLRSVPGIGPSRVEMITRAWKEQRAVRDIMVFLQSHGVSTSKAVRIFRVYGDKAIASVSENPYRLSRDITGIGFKTADSIAQKLGIAKDSQVRARAGIHHVLSEMVNHGQVAYPIESLIPKAKELLEIAEEQLRQAIHLEISEGFLVQEEIETCQCVYPKWLYGCETELARRLCELNKGQVRWKDVAVDKAVAWVEEKLRLSFAPLQKEAIRKALVSKTLILTGGPGTGKTTITRAIVSILNKKKVSMALCSPTGRAAKRMTELTGMEAKTIHRLLGYDRSGRFLHGPETPLEYELVIMDETSMVDLPLMNHVLGALPRSGALILIGDVDQIPPVGPGCVLSALIDSNAIPVVRLSEIFRQGKESLIVSNAHRINQGLFPELKKDVPSDFYFIASETPEKTVHTMVELVKSRIPNRFGLNPLTEIQVLSPMNRGGLGTKVLNMELQKTLNPNPTTKVERFGVTFALGDKVMVTANEYEKEVFNGDIGFIRKIDPEEEEVHVDFDGQKVVFQFSEMDILCLAYAISIHKSQGSEYPAVVIPITMQHALMLKRNLLYTGVTRGKKLVVLIGERRALELAIRSENRNTRWNKLALRIRDNCSG